MDSETETEEAVSAKVSKDRRAKGSPSRDDFRKVPSLVPVVVELEDVLRGRQFRNGSISSRIDTETDSDAGTLVGDLTELNAQELRARAGEKLACILDVAKKSGNLKGEFVGRLKSSASMLRELVDALASRSEAEETRRLRAVNYRLRLEVESSKAEVKALRRGFTEARTEAAAATATAAAASTAAAVATTEAPSGALLGAADMVEELRRSLTVTFGKMLDARLAVFEDRLLPAPTVRPPLKADAKKTAAAKPSKVAASSEPVRQKGKKARKQDSQAANITTISSEASNARTLSDNATEAIPSADPQVETWVTVERKSKRKRQKKKKKSPASAAAPATNTAVSAPAVAVKTVPKVTLKAPKTAAIVLALRPEAVEGGVTYSTVLQRAQAAINLQDLEIEQLRFRQTATGARMLEIRGSQHSEKADRLADKLRGVLSEVASIARPIKTADLDVTGLDDAATKDIVAAAVAKVGGCDVRHVKVREIHRDSGSGSTIVSCPISAAKALSKKGRLVVGWTSVRVVALEARPMRCFRCMGLGHTRLQCPASPSADRGDLCFRCGGTGHQAASCGQTKPHCVVCAESGRPSGHRMGGRSCLPPKTKGKATKTLAVPAATSHAAARAEEASQKACEEVVMSD